MKTSLFALSILMVMPFRASPARADQRDVAMYDDCESSSCPIFQVVVKHHEAASSSRPPGPIMRPEPVAPLPTPTPRPQPRPFPSDDEGGCSVPVTRPAVVPPKPPIQDPAKTPLALTYGLYVASDSVECSKTAMVPNAVFKAVTAVLGSVQHSIDANGGMAPALTPKQQTLLLFYTTIMQQTSNFDCTYAGASLGRTAGGSR